jgi:hypothetical protein
MPPPGNDWTHCPIPRQKSRPCRSWRRKPNPNRDSFHRPGDQTDEEKGIQKAGNDLRAFRWGAVTYQPNVNNIHHTPTFANKAGGTGRIIENDESFPKGNVRGAVACSFAKTRVRQDAERSLRDAGAPREKFPCLKGIIC